jgi:zinc protease
MYVHLETTRENLAAVMPLIAEVLREPAYDAKELEQLRTEMLAGIEQQRKRSGQRSRPTAFQQATKLVAPRGDIRLTRWNRRRALANIRAVSARAGAEVPPRFLRAHSRRRFSRRGRSSTPPAFEESRVGRVVWRAEGAESRSRARHQRLLRRASRRTKSLRDGPTEAQAIYIAGMNLNMRDDDPDFPALDFGQLHAGLRLPQFRAC